MTILTRLVSFLALLLTAVGLLIAAPPTHAQVIYYHTDALGSPVAITDANGQIIERSEYEPYGRLLNHALTDGPGYTGHVSDAVTGLSYMQQRYYDPGIGRFLSMDPVTADPSTGANFNRYWYANNNPYKFVDPDGREIEFAKESSNKFKGQFKQAVDYMNKKKVAGSFAELQKHKETVYIKEAPAGSNDMYYDPATKTVYWDPLSGLKTTDGGVQTPALGLKHEIDHALGDVTGIAKSTKQIDGDPYDTAEEKRVIDEHETPAAKKLGEGIRKDHGGTVKQVKCPTCTE